MKNKFTLVLLFVMACGFYGLILQNDRAKREEVLRRDEHERAIKYSVLPPGINNLHDAPKPMLAVQTLGGCWVYAFCSTGSWDTVIYYPEALQIEKTQLLGVDWLGEETDLSRAKEFTYVLTFAGEKSVRTMNLPTTNNYFMRASREALAYLRSKKEFADQE